MNVRIQMRNLDRHRSIHRQNAYLRPLRGEHRVYSSFSSYYAGVTHESQIECSDVATTALGLEEGHAHPLELTRSW